MGVLLIKKRDVLLILFVWCIILVVIINSPILKTRVINNSTDNKSSEIFLKNNDKSNFSIAIFYDNNYTAPWITYSSELAFLLNETLNNLSINCKIYNGTDLFNYINKNPNGIIITTMGILPYLLWNGSDNSLIEKWIDNGGILIWTGCEEFYWISYPNGTNKVFGHKGAIQVMDMDYLKIRSNQNIEPTSLGSFYIPSIRSHTSDIFTSLKILELNSIYYEAYCQYGDLADPILFQPKNGNGYFIRVHADWIDSLDAITISNWISMIIKNRIMTVPLIKNFEYTKEIMLFTKSKLNLSYFNYHNSSYLYNICVESEFFDPFYFQDVITTHETNKTDHLELSLKNNAIPTETAVIIDIYINKSFNNGILKIFHKNITIKINLPYIIKIKMLPDNVFVGGTVDLHLTIENLLDYELNLSLFVYSPNNIHSVYNLINIPPGENEYKFSLRISWISIPENSSITIAITYNNVVIDLYSEYLAIKPIYESQYFIFLLLIFLIIIGVSIIFSYKLYLRNERIKSMLYNLLIKSKYINLDEFSKNNKIKINKINLILQNLAQNNINLKYIIKTDDNIIKLIPKQQYIEYLKNTILTTKKITFEQIKKMVFITDEELESIIKEFI